MYVSNLVYFCLFSFSVTSRINSNHTIRHFSVMPRYITSLLSPLNTPLSKQINPFPSRYPRNYSIAFKLQVSVRRAEWAWHFVLLSLRFFSKLTENNFLFVWSLHEMFSNMFVCHLISECFNNTLCMCVIILYFL